MGRKFRLLGGRKGADDDILPITKCHLAGRDLSHDLRKRRIHLKAHCQDAKDIIFLRRAEEDWLQENFVEMPTPEPPVTALLASQSAGERILRGFLIEAGR